MTSRAATVLRAPMAIVGSLALLGAPVGLVWSQVSPRVAVAFSSDGPSLVHPEGSEFFDTDGSFLLVLLVAGLLTGSIVWALRRRRGVGVPFGLAAGGVVAGGIAQAVGERVVVDARLADACRQAVCQIYDGTMQVRVGVVHLERGWPGTHRLYLTGIVWAVASLVVFGLLTAIFDRDPAPAPRAWPAPSPAFDWAPPDGSAGG